MVGSCNQMLHNLLYLLCLIIFTSTFNSKTHDVARLLRILMNTGQEEKRTDFGIALVCITLASLLLEQSTGQKPENTCIHYDTI